ncbi:AraC family transcriptional regulator [Cohnella lupini]|nr:AraC family transcriptional regulator [Cohnella lupini]
MSPIRKPFSNDPLFPFELVYKDTKSPERELPDHLHDRYEFVYVHSGRGTFFIDQNFYDMRQGDLFIIPGNSIHRAFPDPLDTVTSSAVFFAPSLVAQPSFDDSYHAIRCFELSRKRKLYKMELDGSLMQRTEDALSEIQVELELKKSGYRQAVSLVFQRWLLLVNRQSLIERSDDPEDAGIGPLWMREILLYIASHPHADLGLTSLARQASVTGAHFSRVFKRLTGMNVTDYVNAKRIVLAKELLVETDDTVSRIAERCGFESLPHFHRVFKKIASTTPGGYKRGIRP